MSPHGLGLGVSGVMWEGQGTDPERCWQRQRWLDALEPCLHPLTPRGGDGGGSWPGPFRSVLSQSLSRVSPWWSHWGTGTSVG